MKKVKPVVTRWIKPPIHPLARLLFDLPEKQDPTPEENMEALRGALDSMGKLFDHFGIERGEWPVLAYQLAVEGGFVVHKIEGTGPGRKAGDETRGQLALWMQVQLFLSDNPGKEAIDALKHLKNARKGQWHRLNIKTLQNKYSNAHKNEVIVTIERLSRMIPGGIREIAKILDSP